MLAEGAGGDGIATFFTRLSFLFSFSLSLRHGTIYTEILSRSTVKQPANQPTVRLYSKANPRDILVRFNDVLCANRYESCPFFFFFFGFYFFVFLLLLHDALPFDKCTVVL